MEEDSSGKLLIGSSRSSKITHSGHEKNFKALRGSVCGEYNGSSKLQGIQRISGSKTLCSEAMPECKATPGLT